MVNRYRTHCALGAALLVALLLAPAAWSQEPTPEAAEQIDAAGQQGQEQVEQEAVEGASSPVASETPEGEETVSPVPTSVEGVTQGVRDAAAGVAEAPGRIWNEYLVPIYERFVQVMPTLLKALVLLLLFWLAAIVIGRLVTGLLQRTDLDNRLAQDLGLGATLEKWEKKGNSLEKVAGRAAKWVVLLFGFVAFFNTLDLGMVAGPLANILTKLTDAIPALLRAFFYLAIYWVVGTLLRMAVTRGLGVAGFDQRAEQWLKPREVKGEMIGPSGQVGRLVFWVVLLFGLPQFLQALGQEAAVQPLRDMMTRFFEFLPNVVAALILVFIGRIVATIVREVVSNFLAATGADSLAQKIGLGATEGSRKLSEIVGSVAFFFTFIPILVAAVDSLRIDAISTPVRNTLEQLLTAIPLIFVALLVLGIGYLVAKTVRGLVEGFLKGVGFDAPARAGRARLPGAARGRHVAVDHRWQLHHGRDHAAHGPTGPGDAAARQPVGAAGWPLDLSAQAARRSGDHPGGAQSRQLCVAHGRQTAGRSGAVEDRRQRVALRHLLPRLQHGSEPAGSGRGDRHGRGVGGAVRCGAGAGPGLRARRSRASEGAGRQDRSLAIGKQSSAPRLVEPSRGASSRVSSPRRPWGART